MQSLYLPGRYQSLLLAMCIGFAPSASSQITATDAGDGVSMLLQSLEPGIWHKIHELTPEDPGFFRRQYHGGAAFDSRRGRIMLFGSDTHAVEPESLDNAVHFFDVNTLSWSHSYEAAPRESYRFDEDGHPVAGVNVVQPWTMHSFDTVEYDAVGDQLIVASHPAHWMPSRVRGGSDKGLDEESWDDEGWDKAERHPLWAYVIAEDRWQKLADKLISGFPYTAVFDPDKRQLIVARPNSFTAFDLQTSQWQTLAEGRFVIAWHTAAVLDSHTRTLVIFGNSKESNQVWQYPLQPSGQTPQAMPTPGVRPPGDQSVPLAYHEGIQRVVALVESQDKEQAATQTWLYATRQDRWQQLKSATLPFRVGMNYNLVYDPDNNVLWLVARAHAEKPWLAVWVLRM